jgi:excisionase family DNA binding protein
MADDSYTSGEVARLLGIPTRTARRYIRSGRIPAEQNPLTGRWRISRAALEAFQDRNRSDGGTRAQRVLLVSARPELADPIAAALRRTLPRARLVTAADAFGALLEIGAAPPAGVIVDLAGGSADAERLVATLCSHPRTAHIPAILLAAAGPGAAARLVQPPGADRSELAGFQRLTGLLA